MENTRVEYHCTHCEHDFTDEEKDVLECPKCFWSSSVKRASEVKKASSTNKKIARPVKDSKKSNKFVFFAIILLIFFLGAIFALKFSHKNNSPEQKQKNLTTSVAIKGLVKNETKDEKITQLDLPPAPVEPQISESDVQFLSSVLMADEVSTGIVVDPILKKAVSFKVGLVEKLPSQIWDLKQFQEMIAQQELNYKVPLSKKYKKDLKEHFETFYIVGGNAFNSGDLLQARDGFVRTLAFPIYSNDIKRHRGIALTQLSPFINDTLSKIGAINTMLVDQQLTSIETKIQKDYQGLLRLIEEEKWDAALKEIKDIQKSVADLQSRNLNEMMAPPYPQPLIGLDPGIAASLADILQPSQTLLSDLNPLTLDLVNKYKKIELYSPEFIEKQLSKFNSVSNLIKEKKWLAARERLAEIKGPEILLQKAREKLNRLEQLGLTKK